MLLVTLAVTLFGFFEAVFAANPLQCYFCDNLYGEACFDPMNSTRIPLVNCSTLWYYGSSSRGILANSALSRMQVYEGSDYVRASSSDQYECYVSVRVDSANFTSINRGCKLKESTQYCDLLNGQSQGGLFNVSKCYTCESDGCNSGDRFGALGGIYTIALATIIAVYSGFQAI